MFPPMTPLGERVRFQNEIKELERRVQRPIHFALVARLKALISSHRPMVRDVVVRHPIQQNDGR